jgi:prepilin-type N-terminal cleavage/methylation domain-containing protein
LKWPPNFLKNGIHPFDKGFALIELMIAIFLFAIFMAVFATSQNYNISDSRLLKEEIILRQLAQQKINQIIIDPPKNFDKSLTLGQGEIETIEGHEQYESKVVYREFKLPDFSKFTEENEDGEGSGTDTNSINSRIFEKVRENFEKLIWQAEVTIRNKETDFKFTFSTWLYNPKAEVNVSGF